MQGYPYRTKLKKKLPIDAKLGDMMADLKKWLPMTDEEILARAIEKYHIHHKAKIYGRQVHPIERHAILVAQGHVCYYCKKELSSRAATIDHKVPLSKGGIDERSNFCAACSDCNTEKAQMTEAEFIAFKFPERVQKKGMRSIFAKLLLT